MWVFDTFPSPGNSPGSGGIGPTGEGQEKQQPSTNKYFLLPCCVLDPAWVTGTRWWVRKHHRIKSLQRLCGRTKTAISRPYERKEWREGRGSLEPEHSEAPGIRCRWRCRGSTDGGGTRTGVQDAVPAFRRVHSGAETLLNWKRSNCFINGTGTTS